MVREKRFVHPYIPNSVPEIQAELMREIGITDIQDHVNFQMTVFNKILEDLKKHQFEPVYRHAANSGAVIEMPGTHLDMVRPCISLYGVWPSKETDKKLVNLKPAMSVKLPVGQIPDVKNDDEIVVIGRQEELKRLRQMM